MASKPETTAETITTVCQGGQLSETVITAIAEAKGVDPLDLEPLYTAVDPDALNEMFRPTIGSAPSALELRFSMADCQVVVHGDGEVVVTPPAETDDTPTIVAPRED